MYLTNGKKSCKGSLFSLSQEQLYIILSFGLILTLYIGKHRQMHLFDRLEQYI